MYEIDRFCNVREEASLTTLAVCSSIRSRGRRGPPVPQEPHLPPLRVWRLISVKVPQHEWRKVVNTRTFGLVIGELVRSRLFVFSAQFSVAALLLFSFRCCSTVSLSVGEAEMFGRG
jgi:hypothetical protein